MATELGIIVADFQTSLASTISIGATTGTIVSNIDDDETTLPDGKYFFTIDSDNSFKEHISCTLTGKEMTVIKSISRQGVVTSGTTKLHRVGATVIITDFAHIKKLNDLLNGTTDLDVDNPLKYDGDPTLSDDAELATKKYMDDVANNGAPDATTSVKGIVKMSVAPASATEPIAVGDNDGRIPTSDENDALAGTGTPSSSNKYVTEDDTNLTNNVKLTGAQTVAGIKTFSSLPVLPSTTPTSDNQAISKKYIDSLLTITSGSITDGVTITYLKIGKVYFAFRYNNYSLIGGSGGDGTSASASRLALKLGKTLSTYGTGGSTYTGNARNMQWSIGSSAWQQLNDGYQTALAYIITSD